MNSEREEARELVLDAQDHLQQAIESLRKYVKLSNDRHTDAYIVDHLKIMASSSHGFLSRDANLDQVLENLDEYFSEEE